MKQYTFKDLIKCLPSDYKVIGDINSISFNKINSILEADKNSIAWIKSSIIDCEELLSKTQSKIIITDKKNLNNNLSSFRKCIILVDNPKLTIIRITNALFSKEKIHKIQVSSIIDDQAIIGKNVHVGENSIIGNCKIGSNSYIDSLCKIGDNTTIGKNVIIHSGAKIGTDGFGYALNANNVYEKFPHIGGVIIEDNVEIGANTCIDRGTLGDTIIKKGVKIDNLSMVAHNVTIGENTIVCSLVAIAGSTDIKSNVWIAPQVSILNGISIGQNSFIGIGSLVIKNVPENQIWAGFPAKKLKIKTRFNDFLYD